MTLTERKWTWYDGPNDPRAVALAKKAAKLRSLSKIVKVIQVERPPQKSGHT